MLSIHCLLYNTIQNELRSSLYSSYNLRICSIFQLSLRLLLEILENRNQAVYWAFPEDHGSSTETYLFCSRFCIMQTMYTSLCIVMPVPSVIRIAYIIKSYFYPQTLAHLFCSRVKVNKKKQYGCWRLYSHLHILQKK